MPIRRGFVALCALAMPLHSCRDVKSPAAKVTVPNSAEAISKEPAAQLNVKRPFWVYDRITQGMSLAEVLRHADERKYKVSHPLNDDTLQLAVGEKQYWLGFCEDRLTYASWTTKTNDQLIKSISKRIKEDGFRIVSGDANANFNDATNSDNTSLTLRLRHPGDATAYSVEYSLFSENGQITLEDTKFDDTINCEPE